MNVQVKKEAKRVYMAAGSSEEDANDLANVFTLLKGWMDSLSDEQKREARAFMDARAAAKKVATCFLLIVGLYGFLWSGRDDLADHLHSEALAEQMRLASIPLNDFHPESQPQQEWQLQPSESRGDRP